MDMQATQADVQTEPTAKPKPKQTLTPEQREKNNARRREYYQKKLRTDPDYREKERKRTKARFDAMTPEEKKEFNRRTWKRRKEREAAEPLLREERLFKVRMHNKAKMDAMTPEEKKAYYRHLTAQRKEREARKKAEA